LIQHQILLSNVKEMYSSQKGELPVRSQELQG